MCVCVSLCGGPNDSNHVPSSTILPKAQAMPRTHRLARRRQGGGGVGGGLGGGGVGGREQVPHEEELLVGVGGHGGERVGRDGHGLWAGVEGVDGVGLNDGLRFASVSSETCNHTHAPS